MPPMDLIVPPFCLFYNGDTTNTLTCGFLSRLLVFVLCLSSFNLVQVAVPADLAQTIILRKSAEVRVDDGIGRLREVFMQCHIRYP